MGKKKDEKTRRDPQGLLKIYLVFGRHYKKYWKTLVVAYVSLFAAIGVAVLSPWPVKLILDYVILAQPLPPILAFLNPWLVQSPKLVVLVLASTIILLALLEAFFSYINKLWVSGTGERINTDIRERVFAHLQRLSLSFHDSARSGNLVYLLTSDVPKMKDLLIDFPQDFIHRFGLFGAYAVFMFAMDWRLGLLAVSIVPLFFLFTRHFGRGLKKALKSKRAQEGEVASIIAENVALMALVQAYGRQESELLRFSAGNKASLDTQLRALRLEKTYNRITDLLVTLSTAAVLYFGGLYTLGGAILPGTLVVFVAYLRDIYGAAEKFSGVFPNLAKAQISAMRLLELVENDMILRNDSKAVPAPPFLGRIEFKNVSFAYKRGKQVLKALNFTVAPGETVALVGYSGAGKSTLVSLLLRFYDPQQGQIRIDGEDIRNFTLKSLRDQITVLLQEAKLFRQTVRENILFGRSDATEAEIVEAARLAEARDFIMQMPEGYDTIIYEGGDNLSGGQKQRINIARAIIRNTPIVILDEPATGLDAITEAKIHAAIRRLTRGKTTFIIAHQLATIANADKILLLEEGQLAHQGSHEQLLRTSTQYQAFYEIQFGKHQKPRLVAAETDGSNGHLSPEKVALDEAQSLYQI
jgi:ATP-binding cassette subfamily B protein